MFFLALVTQLTMRYNSYVTLSTGKKYGRKKLQCLNKLNLHCGFVSFTFDNQRLGEDVFYSTGKKYSRINTTAEVGGRSKEEMITRVANKLKVMRKGSIRFSRGMVS